MQTGRTQASARPEAGAVTRSQDQLKKETTVNQAKTSNIRLYVKLLRSLTIVAFAVAASASAGASLQFDRGSDAAVRTAQVATPTGLVKAGISCSVDSPYGSDFLWSPVFEYAIATVDYHGARSLSLYDANGRSTNCAGGASVRISGAVDIEHTLTAGGTHCIIRASGNSVGRVQLSMDELFARVMSPTDLLAAR